MPWKQKPTHELERKIHDLQVKLLQRNAELRLKTNYCRELGWFIHRRNARIDELTGLLQQARTAKHRLEQKCKHLAALTAASPVNAPILATN